MTEHASRVTYNSSNHFAVLTQMHGSVWPRVLPHCILNILNVSAVAYLDRAYDLDLGYSDKGHTFMSMIVSFLVVTRSNITYSRFMESRSYLSTVMRSCRELMQYVVTFTRYDTSDKAKKWRLTMARKTIVLLRSVVSALQFPSKGEHTWKMPLLNEKEREAVKEAVGEYDSHRTPMILAMFLRSSIASNCEFLSPPMNLNRELKLHSFVSDFISGYHGLTKLIDTQFPFPLAQMTRTFVYIWVYSLPWVLYNDEIQLPALILIVFFITYAFVGLECVSIELDDPYGNDPNDFDVLGMANVVFQDIQICIYDADGKDAAEKLDKYFDFDIDHRRLEKENSNISLNPVMVPVDIPQSQEMTQSLIATSSNSIRMSKRPGHLRRQSSDAGDGNSVLLKRGGGGEGSDLSQRLIPEPTTYGSIRRENRLPSLPRKNTPRDEGTFDNSPDAGDQSSLLLAKGSNSTAMTFYGSDDVGPPPGDDETEKKSRDIHSLLLP